MIQRRAFLALTALAGCRRASPVFRGFAFVANEEGRAVAAVDLQAMAVVRHVRLDASPKDIVVDPRHSLVYALAPDAGEIYAIDPGRLALGNRLPLGQRTSGFRLTSDHSALWVTATDPHRLLCVTLDPLIVESRVNLPAAPRDIDLAPNGKHAVLSLHGSVYLADLEQRKLGACLAAEGDFGGVRFLSDSRTLVVADRGNRRLSVYETGSGRLVSHLPLAVRPDYICPNQDGGQLFVTGEGMDAVVVVYPYHTPQVAETVLAGRAPRAMAASAEFLFIASEETGEVSILNIPSRKVIAQVAVGAEPAFVTVTPGDEYALVLNRGSGDMAVLRIDAITPNRYKTAALLTVIPVGSSPVAAAIRVV